MGKMLHLLLDWEYPHWMMMAGAILVALETLRSLALKGADARVIGKQLNRTGVAVRSRASRLKIPLKKTARKRYQNGRPSTA